MLSKTTVIPQLVVTVEFLSDTLMSFLDPDTLKKLWYQTQMFRGNKMEFANIVSGNPNKITFQCIDDELAVVDTNVCKVLEVRNKG